MIHIGRIFIKVFSPNEQLVMLQLLLNANENGVVEFSDRNMSRMTEIPYQQVRTIHKKWLSDGTLSNAPTNAGANASQCFVTICDFDSYNAINIFSNAVTNAVANALKEVEIIKEKENVFPQTPLQREIENNKDEDEIKEEGTKVPKKKVFSPPTYDEVDAYIREKGFHFDAKDFIDYYEADDWHYGTGTKRKKVESWKRCCLTWEKQRRPEETDMFSQQEEEEHRPKVLVINGVTYR